MSKCDFNKVAKQLCCIFSEQLFLKAPLEDVSVTCCCVHGFDLEV